MKVKDLIAKLQTMPADFDVVASEAFPFEIKDAWYYETDSSGGSYMPGGGRTEKSNTVMLVGKDIIRDADDAYECAQFDENAPNRVCEGAVCRFDGRWKCDECGYDYGGDTLAEPDFTEV